MSRPSRFSRRFLLLGTLAAALRSPTAHAQARLLDAPRAAGQVGEQNDGFAVVRGAAPPEVAKLVGQINAERRAVYAKEAAEKKVTVEAVGKIYAAEIVKAAPAGTWYQDGGGRWVRK